MLKLYENLKDITPAAIKIMPLMQYAEIQGEVVSLLSGAAEAILNKVSVKLVTKMVTGIRIKYKINPKRNNEEIIEIFKRGKLKTLIRFKHDRSGAYGMDTHTIIDHYK